MGTRLLIETRNVEELVPFARNARTHSPEQIDQLIASIRQFGFTNPILVAPDGTVVAGHGRLAAAKAAGLTEVPAITVGADWTAEQMRAYVLADNQLALNAGWDADLLKLELSELKELDFDIGVIGFDLPDLAEIFSDRTAGKTDPDHVPDPPADPVSRLGDMWLLGAHRIVCGDSTDKETAARLLGDVTPNLMVTDPPYGVKYDPKWRDDLGIDWVATSGKMKKSAQRLSTHPSGKPLKSRSLGKVENDDRADWREAWDLFPGNIAYVWHGGLHAAVVQQSLEASKFSIRTQIVWVKQHFVFSRGDYHWRHEPCWYAVRKSGNWTGDRKQDTVWEIENASAFHGKKDDQTTGHGTQKPVECMKRPIENNSGPGDAVYEPFSGSGTTIIAGEMAGRRVFAIELSPAYVDVAVERWQAFTGKEATHAETGRTFAEMRRARKGNASSNTSITPRSQSLKRRGGSSAPTSEARTDSIPS